MPTVKYDTVIDLSNANNSHALMVELVGSNKTVLDVGCATGYLARALGENGCVVSGVERDPGAAAEAAPHLANLVVGDLETTDLVDAFGTGAFDVVVFGDVLEHLRDPLPVLRQGKALLARGGSVVASLPNVAHGSVRLALLAGRFDYGPLGLLDETHLRFFTRVSLERTFRQAGMVPVDLRRTTAGLFDTHVYVDPAEVPPGVLDAVMADPEALTHQFVLRAVVDDADAAVWELHERLEAQRDRLVALQRDLTCAEGARRDAEARAEVLAARIAELEPHAADVDEARAELTRLMATRTMRAVAPLRLLYDHARNILRR